jgi:hypothetical protein
MTERKTKAAVAFLSLMPEGNLLFLLAVCYHPVPVLPRETKKATANDSYHPAEVTKRIFHREFCHAPSGPCDGQACDRFLLLWKAFSALAPAESGGEAKR